MACPFLIRFSLREASLVIARRTDGRFLSRRAWRRNPLCRGRLRRTGGGWSGFFHDGGARGQEHSGYRDKRRKNNKFFHSWSCSFKDHSAQVPLPDVFPAKISGINFALSAALTVDTVEVLSRPRRFAISSTWIGDVSIRGFVSLTRAGGANVGAGSFRDG